MQPRPGLHDSRGFETLRLLSFPWPPAQRSGAATRHSTPLLFVPRKKAHCGIYLAVRADCKKLRGRCWRGRSPSVLHSYPPALPTEWVADFASKINCLQMWTTAGVLSSLPGKSGRTTDLVRRTPPLWGKGLFCGFLGQRNAQLRSQLLHKAHVYQFLIAPFPLENAAVFQHIHVGLHGLAANPTVHTP